VIPRWTAGGLKLSEIATALSGVAEGSIFQSKNDTEIDFRFQRKVRL
jgi:hypothetical protein